MKYSVLSLLIIFVIISCKSQKDIPVELYNCNDMIYFTGQNDIKLKDFIDSSYYTKRSLISNIKDLEKIPLQISNDSLLIFKYDKYEILIEISSDTFVMDSNYKASEINALNTMLYLQEKLGNNLFGSYNEIENKVYFKRIKNIEIDEMKRNYTLPNTLFSNFLNPNVFHNFLSLKPIEMYFDKKKKLICIYVMGTIKFDSTENEYFYNQSSPSYINKIVFDINNKVSSNISISSKILNRYGWPFCKNFLPF